MAKKIRSIHSWECPGEGHYLLKPETILLGVFVILVFAFSFITFNQQILPSIIAAIMFLVVFFLVDYLFKKVYLIKENYHLTGKGIVIEKIFNDEIKRYFIKYEDIKKYKLDKFFHGGRLETKKRNHPLFFNTTQEINKFERILKKKLEQ